MKFQLHLGKHHPCPHNHRNRNQSNHMCSRRMWRGLSSNHLPLDRRGYRRNCQNRCLPIDCPMQANHQRGQTQDLGLCPDKFSLRSHRRVCHPKRRDGGSHCRLFVRWFDFQPFCSQTKGSTMMCCSWRQRLWQSRSMLGRCQSLCWS